MAFWGLSGLLFSDLLFCSLDLVCEDADRCQQHLVQVKKSRFALLRVLSIQSCIDRHTDAERIELQEAAGAAGCPGPSGFISPDDCQKTSDSAGDQ